MNPVIHFEMPYDDAERLARFYQAAFGWKMQSLGEEMGNYVMAMTIASDGNGRPTKVGAINGGFFEKKPDWPAQHPSVVIGVGDIEAAMDNVRDAGGQVLGTPMQIPGVGAYVSFTDPEGNRVSLLQPLPMAKPARKKASAKKKAATKKKASAKKPAAKKAAAKKGGAKKKSARK